MKRFIFDSGIANKYLDAHPVVISRVKAELRAGNLIGIGTPILGELRAGLEFSVSKDANLAKLEKALLDWKVWVYDEVASEEFAEIKSHLQRIGRRIQDIDIQLAAIAHALPRCTVVTMDSDFAAIPGLSLENWMTP